MKKILFCTIVILFFISSCSGILWDSDGFDELKISINNPFYQSGSYSSSRALALQGDYLYIELALIDDQAAYNADTELALTGNGSWVSTSWGGHAILTFNLSNWTETLEAVFTDVPRGQDLKARVILELSDNDFISGLEGGYSEVEPISYTYNSNASDLFEPVGSLDRYDWMWSTVTAAELAGNIIILPIRPESISSQSLGAFSLDSDFSDQVPEEYVDSSTATQTATEPLLGETEFTLFEIETNAVGSYFPQSIAFYVMQYVDRQTIPNAPLPGVVALYDDDGSIVTEVGGDDFSLFPSYPYRSFSIVYPDLDASYYNNDYFMGSTLFSGADLASDGINYTYTTDYYDVVFGVLNDGNVLVSSSVVNWNLPPYFTSSDFEFKIIETTQTSLVESNIETLSQIYNLAPFDTETAWMTGVTSYDSGSDIEDGSGKWVFILARMNGGAETVFIYGTYYITEG